MTKSNREASAKYFIYADDDQDDRNTLAEMINEIDQHLQVITVDNGMGVVDYLKKLLKEQILPCFILLDLNMPVMDGFTTLRWLKNDESWSSIPTIVFTTSRGVKDHQLAIRLGADRFITKPFSHKDMRAITQQFADFCHDVVDKRK